MPTIFESKDLPIRAQNGIHTTTLADPAMLGTDVLKVERIELEAAGKTPVFKATDSERFIYVIRGKGQAQVAGRAFPLDVESVLWLEKEDVFSLEAGVGGLEVLLCHAPAKE